MTKHNDIYTGRMQMTNKKQVMSNEKRVTSNALRITHYALRITMLLLLLSSVALAADNLIISDPLTIGVGARPLGMGKAYVAVAEDGDTVFMNPAGLGKINSPKITSMYSNLIGDVNYIVLGGAYPYNENSAIGAGAVVSGVSDISLYDTAGASLGSANWGSSVMFVSYGMNIPDNNLQVGGSVKYYSQGGSGGASGSSVASSIEAASATGIGLDVGAKYSVSDDLSFGILAQNPLGVKLTSKNGIDNTIPAVIKAGVKNTLYPAENQKINLAADVDISKSSIIHLGAEYYPMPTLALRAGMDDSNLTAGIGLRTSGMEFNYAYHPYGAIAENGTHYFSISYIGPDKVEEQASTVQISLLKPEDKSVIYSDNVEVLGTVKSKNASNMLKINGINAAIDPAGNFRATVPIDKVGKKGIIAEVSDAKGAVIAKQTRKVLRLTSFADVSGGYWAKKPIEHVSTVGLVQGYPDSTFRPDSALTRAELATLLVRAKGMQPPMQARQVFKDVKAGFWAAGYIEAAQRAGMIKGYPDKKFRPNNRVSKAEAIAILARFDGLAANAPMAAPYSDVPTKHWSARYVAAAKEAGILNFIEGGRLRPREEVTRAESVEMLSKTNMAGKMINDLLSWDKGFEFEISRPSLKAGLEQ